MATDDPIDSLVLQEFRLHAADTAGEAARIVATFAAGSEPAVPLLVSIDDRRDVATIHARHTGEPADAAPGLRAALDPLVASWQPLKVYGARITERAERLPSHYRLAVTESGINNADTAPAAANPSLAEATTTRIRLMWVGAPRGTYAGLLILLGNDDERSTGLRPDAHAWPRPLSGALGVRIYDSRV